MGKAKLIKSTLGSKSNPQGKWYKHDQIKPFIQGIIAGELDIDQVSSSLISGVPTPWARTKLLWFAFDYLKNEDANIETSGLIEFYKMLINEWRGLIALIALYPDRVTFSEPIYLNAKNKDLYEVTSALGRLLFEDADLWTNQIAKQQNPDELPYVQLLRYNGQLIGATSPFSIIFPAVEYEQLKFIKDVPWYRNNKFEDPTNILANDIDKIQKLYLFVKNINNNFQEFENNLNIGRGVINQLDLSGLKKNLRTWQLQLENNHNLLQNGTVAKYSNLVMPYKSLLTSFQRVYQLNTGEFTFNRPKDESIIKAELDDLQNILKEDKKIIGWYETSNKNNPLSSSAVYYLKINDLRDRENPTKYFTLPLSMQGIHMFTHGLKRLVSHQDPNFDIVGKISEQGNLIVDLTVEIDGHPYKLNSKEYEIEWLTSNKKVIMWPNFISDNWDAYYLYSEYPSNVQGIRFIPFFKKGRGQNIITIEKTHGEETIKSVLYSNSASEERQEAKLDLTNLITYPAGQVPQDMHKYEVLKSNHPIAGLEVRIESSGNSEIAGYLIVKGPGDDSMGNKKIVDLTTDDISRSVTVGIDFGSNNSCVHYTVSEGSHGAQPIQFKNRRLALVGNDAKSGGIAERDELLFFSNEETPNGQIKSWLHEHDSRYSGHHYNKEIAGGVAVNEKNILVKEMDKEKITTQAGVLNYNMKWLSNASGLSKKTAYLKALWLSVCADLYSQKYLPTELRWSFPGSMSSMDISKYRIIYSQQLPSITPILNKDTRVREVPRAVLEKTESESVCNYALSRDYGLNNNLFLGIDVGGSTSDILLLAKDIDNNNNPRLYKQSSIRLAAGVFFDAVIKSASFRKAIYNFHQGQNEINVENIKEILTEGHKAPFYLNNVFDQLTKDSSTNFYSFIGLEASFVYAIPAYVTGLLVYYAGKLSASTIRDNNLTAVREVHLLPFGKGGRLFHWLDTIPGSRTTDAYFEECFRKGFGEGVDDIKFVNRGRDISDDNKSEVSMGLAVDTDLVSDSDIRLVSDIFAEKNIRYLKDGQFIEFDEHEVASDEYFENIGQFEFPEKLENFDEFLRIFIDFVGHKAGLVKDIAVLEKRSKELSSRLSAYIQNDSEYKKARNTRQDSTTFEYRMPILIAEGLCFLEQILIPEIFKS